MECDDAESKVEVRVATAEPFSGADPRSVDPSMKLTLPVGLPVPGAIAETAAVKVTD